MDFGTLLHTAKNNDKSSRREGVRYYSTKFEPPKKEQRNKQLSENIKKFLARKEEEERQKQLAAQRKKDELFALRAQDKKSTRRVNVMLKRTKSANQSVIQDAVDTNNTSVTLAGPIQPDEDDYGYVSQEAAAFYNKMMEKYNKIPTNQPQVEKKNKSSNLNSTKDRVKAALEKERLEATLPFKRKRTHKETTDTVAEDEPSTVVKPKKRVAAPPPINFNDLLKIAEKKQFEPIVIEQKPKEEERLFTKKQKIEMVKEKEWRERKEGKLPPLVTKKPPIADVKKVLPAKEQFPSKRDQSSVPVKNAISAPTSKIESKKNYENNVPSKSMAAAQDSKKRVENLKCKQLPLKDVMNKPNKPVAVKPRQVPTAIDVTRKVEFPPRDVKRKPVINKRRILDDDEEYDSEMDDFIDDGPEAEQDYSKYINEIFGYDKSKYRNLDDDIDNMESSFAQQMREEVISTKIGIMEDLEDMKKEEEEKRRKALRKKNKF